MSDKRIPDEAHDLDGTQPLRAVDASRHLPAPPDRSHVHQAAAPAGAPEKRKRRDRRRDRRSSGLYLPAWSVAVMLLIVFGIAASIVTLMITLGGGTAAGGEPRFVIITAVPSATSDAPATAAPVSTLAGQGEPGAVPTFALEGPTLPPIIFSPTPLTITVGSIVTIDGELVNVRAIPGLQGDVLFQAEQDERFEVLEGPQQASELTWWRIQSPDDPDLSGWAAATYLKVETP
jgi:hypothetical protein